MGKKKRVSGTREWAASTCNCVTGCSHDCKYCYARYDMVDRYHRMARDEWKVMRVRKKDVDKKRKMEDGVVMFPTTHDITPETLEPCVQVLGNLVRAGNAVLVVSKPHLECIRRIVSDFRNYRENIMFRFTIGAMSNAILRHWEPGAPSFQDRLACLKFAHRHGFRTSVSCEPLLEANFIAEMVKEFDPYVTDTIWIGKLNHVDKRVKIDCYADQAEFERVKDGQTDDMVRHVYEGLKDNPKIRWKESYKEVLGLKLAEEAGLDV